MIHYIFQDNPWYSITTLITKDENQYKIFVNKPMHRVDVKYVTPAAGNYRKPDGTTWGAPIYSNQLLVEETRSWDPSNKCYFFPIYRSEMNKNTKLIENPGS